MSREIAGAARLGTDDDDDEADRGVQLIDPGIPDTYMTGVRKPEFKDGVVRITCVVNRALTARTVGDEVVARLVLTEERFFAALAKVASAAMKRPLGAKPRH